jgi:hypothetical protein
MRDPQNRRRAIACAVSAQNEMSFGFTPLRDSGLYSPFPGFLGSRLDPHSGNFPSLSLNHWCKPFPGSPCLRCSSRLAKISPLFERRLTLSAMWQFLPG